ncbi:MAG: hypothetical protein KDC87_09930 [Planctomycetes bacterium]|nr:hypothetical protein [Planctomycetota bacterium]MCB9869120.1 hypothetical protein [Planctomycetota bacterium]
MRADPRSQEATYYRIVTFPEDSARRLEVSAMLRNRDGTLLIATRTGSIWLLHDPYLDDPKSAKFTLWASGLAQPLGLLALDGWIYTAQRGELTRMKDRDGDGRADVFETVYDGWGISGNYHEYNFGPRVDRDGKLWVTTNKPFGEEPLGKAHWRGWALRIDPATGTMEPMCAGLRSPAGVEVSPWGDVFYTDNQGEWCNASKLAHLEHGDFHGHPHGLVSKQLAGEPFASIPKPRSGTFMKDLKQTVPQFKMPAVWFPYDKMGKSPSGMLWDLSRGAFGPFGGQLLVGDQHHASVMRVFLEKIGGHWQGACFPFREGFQCGITRLCQGEDGSLFCGMTNAGWGSKGNKRQGLQRLVWTREVPLEILTMQLQGDGFLLSFTKPLDADGVAAARFAIDSYTYRLESRYGGPEADKRSLSVATGALSEDGRSLRVTVRPLRPGYVHELRVRGLKARDGTPLLHEAAYYTLVRRNAG